MARQFVVTVICYVLLASAVSHTQEQTGAISGTARDQTGAVLAGVVVEARGRSLIQPAVARTDASGGYAFRTLPPGSYDISAALPAFSTKRVPDIELLLGQQRRIDLTLEPAAVAEDVTVKGRAGLVDAGHAAAYFTIDRPSIDLLPGDRDLTSLLRLAPGVGTGVAANGIDGATNLETKLLVDGLEVSDQWYSMSSVQLLAGAAEEVQVKASGHAAEFRAGTGGVVNIVTRSGSNRYSGGLGTHVTIDHWQARAHPALQAIPTDPAVPYPAYPVMPWRTWEPWAELGGPAVKNRVWFFTHYGASLYSNQTTVTFRSNGERRTIDSTATSGAPTWSVTLQPAGKVRVRASGMHNFVRFRGTPPLLQPDGSSTSDPNYDYAGWGFNYREHTYGATLDYTPADRLQLSVTAGVNMYSQTSPRLPSGPYWQFVGSNQQFPEIPADLRLPDGSCNCEIDTFGDRKSLNRRQSVNVSGSTWFTGFGRHALKGGVQFERITNDVDGGELTPHIYLYWDRSYQASDGSLNRGTYGYYRVGQRVDIGRIDTGNVGVFAQDDWAVASRLTINLGLRADREDLPAYRPGDVGIHFGFGDKISPRVGFAWDVRGDSRWRVYGSAGRFQDVTKLSVARDQFGVTRNVESYYTLDTYDWRSINCSPWIGGCPGRLIVMLDNRIPMTTARPALQALGYNSQIEPNLKPFQSNEAAVGIEHALRSTLTVGARYVHKWIDRALDDVGVVIPGMGTVKFLANPGFGVARQVMGSAYPSLPKAVRDYDAVEFTFRRRMSGGWMLNGSYTWSRVFGNYGGLADVDRNGNMVANESSAFNTLYASFDRNAQPVLGELPTSYPHTLKVQGAYQSRWGTSIGVNVLVRSGTLQQRFLMYGGDRIYFDGRGSLGRTPTYSGADLRLQQSVRFSSRLRATLSLNVLNVFNQKTVTAIQSQVWRGAFPLTSAQFFSGFDPSAVAAASGLSAYPTYGMASGFQSPRSVRVSAGFEF